MLVFFSNVSHEISGQIFGLVSFFLSNRQLRVVLDGKSSQEYPINAGDPQLSNFFLYFSQYKLMTFLIMLIVILLSILMILLSTLDLMRYLACSKN